MDRGSRKKATPFEKNYSHAPSFNCCAHCERKMNDFAGGYSRGYKNEMLCHPNAANRPDCYALVTRYQHPTPCDSQTCYEDHAELMTYVKAREDASKTSTTAGSVPFTDLLHMVRDS